MKKILFIYNKEFTRKHFGDRNTRGWVDDCKEIYDIKMWGKGYSEETTLQSLNREIDSFKPDYIYSTARKIFNKKRFGKWLPDLTSIKNIPKIFVEVDNAIYDCNDSWYRQFDILMCRCPWWNGWDKIPIFKWSVPEKAFNFDSKDIKKNGIYFVGSYGPKKLRKNKKTKSLRLLKSLYLYRRKIKEMFKEKVIFVMALGSSYWRLLSRASCLLCPAESSFGNFVPAKIFEFSTSGAAILTNCDLIGYDMKDLDEVVIKYTSLDDLKDKLDMDFSKYYRKAQEVMRNHTHKIRYKELFG